VRFFTQTDYFFGLLLNEKAHLVENLMNCCQISSRIPVPRSRPEELSDLLNLGFFGLEMALGPMRLNAPPSRRYAPPRGRFPSFDIFLKLHGKKFFF
jgi:hypothetical protein